MEASAIPKKASQPRFFYGWWIVAVAFIGDMMSAGTGSYSMGVFLKPMSEALGWTRTMITGALTMRAIVSGLSSPPIGALVDRFGARIIMVVGALLGGASLIMISQVQQLWHFYLFFGVLGALGIAEFGGLVTSTAVAKWFIRKRGRALAIATMGVSTGGIIFPLLVEFLRSTFDWRFAWVVLGILVWVLVTIPSAVLMRSTPESMGLRPDGEPSPVRFSGAAGAGTASEEVTWTLGQAMRTRAFWLIIPAFSLGSMSLGATMTHIVAYMSDRGFPSAVATASLTTFAVGALLSKPLWGFLAERIHVRYCDIGMYVGGGVSFLILLSARQAELVFAYALLLGLTAGASAVLDPLTWANYYGRTFVGTIRGAVAPFRTLTGAGGPLFAALVFDLTRSYEIAFVTFAVTSFLGAFLMYLAKPPQAPASLATQVPALFPSQ